MCPEITPLELKKWLDDDLVHLIDVREHFEYLEQHILGAKLLSLSTFDPFAVPTSGDKKIVFYCRSGARSLDALTRWRALEKNILAYNLSGGIEAWKSANLPVR